MSRNDNADKNVVIITRTGATKTVIVFSTIQVSNIASSSTLINLTSTASVESASSIPSNSSTSYQLQSQPFPVSAIVILAIAGIAALCLILFFFIKGRHRHKSKNIPPVVRRLSVLSAPMSPFSPDLASLHHSSLSRSSIPSHSLDRHNSKVNRNSVVSNSSANFNSVVSASSSNLNSVVSASSTNHNSVLSNRNSLIASSSVREINSRAPSRRQSSMMRAEPSVYDLRRKSMPNVALYIEDPHS